MPAARPSPRAALCALPTPGATAPRPAAGGADSPPESRAYAKWCHLITLLVLALAILALFGDLLGFHAYVAEAADSICRHLANAEEARKAGDHSPEQHELNAAGHETARLVLNALVCVAGIALALEVAITLPAALRRRGGGGVRP